MYDNLMINIGIGIYTDIDCSNVINISNIIHTHFIYISMLFLNS